MDVHEGIVKRFGDDAGYLTRLSAALAAAREAGIAVIYVVVGFRSPTGPPGRASRGSLPRMRASGPGWPRPAWPGEYDALAPLGVGPPLPVMANGMTKEGTRVIDPCPRCRRGAGRRAARKRAGGALPLPRR
jgi:hypothetical protein